MIYLRIGLPSRFGEWCTRVLCGLVQAALGQFDLASGDTLDQVAIASIKARARHLVMAADQPTGDLRAALASTRRRFVIALDDPYAALHDLVTEHGIEWKSAVRATATSCASMMNLENLPGGLVLRADREGRDAVATASAIANWLDLDVTPADVTAVVQQLPDPVPISAQYDLEAWWAQTSTRDRSIAEGALAAYKQLFSGGRMGDLVWARDLFFVGDQHDASADQIIEVGGPGRCLLFGPYMAVPLGLWAATLVLAVSRSAANLDYDFEVVAGSQFKCLGRGVIQPHREGVCEATIEFAITELTDQPIEIRVFSSQTAFDGQLALVHVGLVPRLRKRAEIPIELSAALGLSD